MRTAARALLPRAQPRPGTDLGWVSGGKRTEPDHMAEPERTAGGQGGGPENRVRWESACAVLGPPPRKLALGLMEPGFHLPCVKSRLTESDKLGKPGPEKAKDLLKVPSGIRSRVGRADVWTPPLIPHCIRHIRG